MTGVTEPSDRITETMLAELTVAAHGVALQHGIMGSFLEVELDLWQELWRVLSRQAEEHQCLA